ncbi:disulfide bond formation protein B [Frigidibacter sp. MR17.24]|uniref:disulfide bond formation protein B n=1 Tax=Frigidibacter sp. MR17.24 TaxID=3127345 RepID=UPI003012D0C1
MRLGLRSRVGAAAAGSAALLLGALGFQYLGGIPPCHLCMDQRWVHVAALLVGIVAIITRRGSLAVIGSLIAVGSAMLAGYHVGVEQGVFAGPSSCTSDPVGSLGVDELYRRI